MVGARLRVLWGSRAGNTARGARMSPGISTRLLATQSDERLLALVRQGHERAFEALVHRYRRPLLNYCRRFSLPESRAEDILQQALLKTWVALREGAEVRDLKAWLYRVVHNTAVNAVRDAAHDGEPVADPALRAGAGQTDIERGLVLREALAEVAALPQLQREVIVRTAVGGYSHEQVAIDLGITDGAVRGLLYRARSTLRTAVTALTPPPLLAWLGGRVEQSGPAPERLSELAAGGGGAAAAGFGGLLAKSGVALLAVGTLITGAAAVHVAGVAHHRAPVKVAAVSSANSASGAQASSGGSQVVAPATISSRVPAGAGHKQRQGVSGRRGAESRGPGSALRTTAAGGGSDRSTAGSGADRVVVPASAAPTSPGTSSPSGSTQNTDSTQSTGSTGVSAGQAEGAAGEGSGSGAQSSPGGAAAGSGSGSAGSSAPSSGGDAEAPAGDGSSGGSSQSGSGSSGSSPSGSSGTEGSGSQGDSGSSSSEQSGGVVGTVVHEVGNLLEHLLP